MKKFWTNTKQLLELIAELLHILGSPERLMEVIREELEAIQTTVTVMQRRTEITRQHAMISTWKI